MSGTDWIEVTVNVSDRGKPLSGVFVSVTSRKGIAHGRSKNGSVSLKVRSNSKITVTAYRHGYWPRITVIQLSSKDVESKIGLKKRVT